MGWLMRPLLAGWPQTAILAAMIASQPRPRRTTTTVPRELRDCVILLHFAKPIPRAIADEFIRVVPSPEIIRASESRPFRPDLSQPHTVGVQLCPNCLMPMKRVSVQETACVTPGCTLPTGRPSREVRHVNGPKRGVVKVLVASDFVVNPGQTIELVDRCALVLDRRYSETARRMLLRTCGTLCELLRVETGVEVRLR